MTAHPATAKVSNRGQMCLPAEVRRRWGLTEGGDVVVIDDGARVILMPVHRRAAIVQTFADFVNSADYHALVETWDDPDLLTE